MSKSFQILKHQKNTKKKRFRSVPFITVVIIVHLCPCDFCVCVCVLCNLLCVSDAVYKCACNLRVARVRVVKRALKSIEGKTSCEFYNGNGRSESFSYNNRFRSVINAVKRCEILRKTKDRTILCCYTILMILCVGFIILCKNEQI